MRTLLWQAVNHLLQVSTDTCTACRLKYSTFKRKKEVNSQQLDTARCGTGHKETSGTGCNNLWLDEPSVMNV